MEFFSVDRIEGKTAVLEDDDENIIEISLDLLPSELKETDVVSKDENGVYRIDPDETKRRKDEAMNLANELFNK